MRFFRQLAAPWGAAAAGLFAWWFAVAARPPVFGQESPPALTSPGSVEDLMRRSDPLADDWPTERLAVHARRQLDRLGEALIVWAGGSESADVAGLELFAADARVALLVPATEQVMTTPTMSVRRASTLPIADGPTLAPADGLDAFITRFRSADPLRITFEITSVDLAEDGSFSTTANCEAYGRVVGDSVQRNAVWQIVWKTVPNAERPLIHSISVTAFSEVVTDKPLFVECTTSVLPDDDTWRRQVLRGGEHWYGKIDAVGELNYMGHHGIAVGDVNGDGLDDVYVAMGTGLPNLLYVQNADGTFRETAEEAGVAWLDDTKGVLLIDVDNDGDQDLLCAMGPTVVYCRNDGTGRFTPARRMRAASDAAFYSLAAADYDGDGDLDVYACRYVMQRYGLSVPMPFHDAENGPPNHLLRNDGDAGFTDVTYDVGLIVNNNRFSLAAGWADYDRDGDPDLYVANDFGRNNLYRNDGGRFVDVAAQTHTEDSAAGMGVSWSDFDLDGDLDLYVSNMFSAAGLRVTGQSRFKGTAGDDFRREVRRHCLGNSLLVNSGEGTFVDDGDRAGTRPGGWAWGATFTDVNDDGYDDLIVPNGFLSNDGTGELASFFWRRVASRSPTSAVDKAAYVNGWVAMTRMMDAGGSWSGHEHNRCFVNLGDGTFVDASAVSGLDFLDDGRAMAVTDLEGDGDLDVWLRNRSGPQLRFLRNTGSPDQHFVAFKLRGKTCNRDAVGATVTVYAGGKTWRRTVVAGDGYLAQSSKWLHFGLGLADRIDRVVVDWPGAAGQEFTDLPVDRRYRLEQGENPIAEPTRSVTLAPTPVAIPPPSGTARVVLRVPLPLPPSLTSRLSVGHSSSRALLVYLWAHGCAPCLDDLTTLAANMARAHEAGLDVVALSVDKPEDHQKARITFDDKIAPRLSHPGLSAGVPTDAMSDAIDAVLRHVLAKPGDITPPAGLLVDRAGSLQIVYLGPVSIDQLLTDAADYGARQPEPYRRAAFIGRWYYAMPRDYESLARDLVDRGRRDDARFYVELERQRRHDVMDR